MDQEQRIRAKDEIKGRDNGPSSREITIGAFTLKEGTVPGKIWMTSPSGQSAEVDEKVLEDVLKSFF